MKRIIIFSSVALAFAFTSCKKDYTCTCTYTTVSTDPVFPYNNTGVENIKIEGANKTEARAACIEAEVKQVSGYYSFSQKCDLKK